MTALLIYKRIDRVILYKKNNAASLDSSQSLVAPAPSTASLPVQKKGSPRAVQSSLRWQFVLGEPAAVSRSVNSDRLCSGSLPCAHFNFYGLKHL